MSAKLHNAFIADATKVREAIAACDVSRFSVSVRIEGRTLSDADECKITYRIEAGWESVEGDSIEACLEEAKRRHGWQARHAPLALAAPRAKATVA